MQVAEPLTGSRVQYPYPGLRPFESTEEFLFYGRESHTAELLRRLSENRFLAVVGNSGSGKSSLVRAGLLPALYRGRLIGATSRWRICVMRPGSAPLEKLAETLAGQGVFSTEQDAVRKELARSSLGLVRAVRASNLGEGESLLLVVDQFEELFRFAKERKDQDGGAEATLFVSSLLEAAGVFTAPVYVVLTIRSDYIGDCTQFAGLPEELNRSQYLIPRLTREQLREAIERPLRLVGAAMNPRLVERLLNDVGDDPGRLPVLQHALNRTFHEWRKAGAAGEIDTDHYVAAGTLAGALDAHADALWQVLEAGGYPSGAPVHLPRSTRVPEEWQYPVRPWAEKVFRCLTVVENGRRIRRPTRLDRIYDVVGANDEASRNAVLRVVETYSRRDDSLLVYSGRKLEDASVIDIPHESLMTHWAKLEKWVEEEAEAAAWYRSAAEDAARFRKGQAATWRNPKLAGALPLLDGGHWNQAWADRQPEYGATFDEVRRFLKQGESGQQSDQEKEEQQRAKELADAQSLAAAESRARENAEARADAQRKEKEAATALAVSQRRAKRWLSALASALLVMLAGSIFSWQRQVEAERMQVEAERRLRMLSESLGENEQRTRIMKDDLKYVWIPPGKFVMGCSPGDGDCQEGEKPAHEVEISKGFWIGQTEVTQAAWKKVMGGGNPSHFKGDQLPVEQISWDQARDYCTRIGGRLPTEAEWEYAARGGARSMRYMELDSVAWYGGNSGRTTHPVAKKLPNRFGLYDSLGNVWEWTADWYDEKYYEQKVAMDPTGPSSGRHRILRGGSSYVDPQYVRVSVRSGYGPTYWVVVTGVRCAGEFR